MRTVALPSMLDVLARNYAYHNKSAKLYELAKVYLPTGDALPQEPKMLVLGAYGAEETFFTLKGELEAVLAGLRVKKTRLHCSRRPPHLSPRPLRQNNGSGKGSGLFGSAPPPDRPKLRAGRGGLLL
ncbi:MAG: hypothetical protein ACLVHV_14840 [Oscillospiraceae bacterium]